MSAMQVQEVLSLWREAERLSGELPPEEPLRRVVTHEALKLRRNYRHMTRERADESASVLRSDGEVLESTRRTLEAARARLDPPRSHPGRPIRA